ncbi:MAG: hypothetical protein AAF662_15615 [Pseudomonadota bacterium]
MTTVLSIANSAAAVVQTNDSMPRGVSSLVMAPPPDTTLFDRARSEPDSYFLVVYLAPEVSLALDLAHGHAVDEWRLNWLAETESILSFLRRHPTRSEVANALYVLDSGADKDMELIMNGNTVSRLVSATDSLRIEPVYELAAQVLINEFDDVKALAEELQEMHGVREAHTGVPVWRRAIDSYSRMASRVVQDTNREAQPQGPIDEGELSNVLAHNELLQIQLNQLQAEFELAHIEQQRSRVAPALNKRLPSNQKNGATVPSSSELQPLMCWARRVLLSFPENPSRLLAKRSDRDQQRRINEQVVLLESSKHFDSDWYLLKYPDVRNSGVSSEEHYLKFGAIEGRNPSTKFDTLFYLLSYPDVMEAGMNPLVHFIQYGEKEGRKTLPKR